jgi:elongation factor 1-gamma
MDGLCAATEVDPGIGWYLYPRLGYLPYVQVVSCV